MLCRHELITIVTPLRRPGSAKTAASVCLYSVYRKQERSLFTAALEQTSNVPTSIIRPRPTAGLWSPIPGIRSAMASLRNAARLLFDRCATAPETRPLPAVSSAHPPRRRLIVQRCPTGGGRRWFPGPSSAVTGYRKAYCERDNCHRSLRSCYQSITCCFTAAVAHIPDAWTPMPRNKGQWHIKAVAGRGNRCYAAVSW